ncbi:MAG: hypothetical protein K8S55_13635 [Phycisphaerae bacterium]|nr:hypothetical protein [Phycisphaerae bacterium]
MMRKHFRGLLWVGLAVAVVAITAQSAAAASWVAQPLTVHEWGVNEFDWSGRSGDPLEGLPAFIYTNKSPGKPLPAPAQKVKAMRPDSGLRFKPILYFYPPRWGDNVPVGVEVRFAFGHANAWWPQVNVYRTPKQVAAAKPVDWVTWRKKHGLRRFARGKTLEIPDDKRFELVWYDLKLTKKLPKGLSLPGAKLPKDHWVKLARQPSRHYVSNGKQVEKYLFYEGATREVPAVTILSPNYSDKRYHIINTGEFPIYDVFVIYRDKGRQWTKYLAVLPPVPAAKKRTSEWGHRVQQITSLPIPNFARLPAGKMMGDEEFRLRTSGRLVETLTAGGHHTESNGGSDTMRDPADPQPTTKMHHLFKAEAEALEKIWRKDFFQSAGLTIVYRESPAYLDKAMPLNIYTDMYHYVKLSRCGLVLNRNIQLSAVVMISSKIGEFFGEKDPKKAAAIIDSLRTHRLMALGVARYKVKQNYITKQQHDQLKEKLNKNK